MYKNDFILLLIISPFRDVSLLVLAHDNWYLPFCVSCVRDVIRNLIFNLNFYTLGCGILTILYCLLSICVFSDFFSYLYSCISNDKWIRLLGM